MRRTVLLALVACSVLWPAPGAGQESVALQMEGVAPVGAEGPEAARAAAIESARWNAMKSVIARHVRHAAEDDDLMGSLRERVREDLASFVLAEMVVAEVERDGLYQVSISVRLNSRRVVDEVNRILSRRSGGAVKPRVLLLLTDDAGGTFAHALAEQLNARGLFDLKERAVLERLVGEKMRERLAAGTLDLADIEALRNETAVQREVDFLVHGNATFAVAGGGRRPAVTLSVGGARVVDVSNAQVVATATDTFEAAGASLEAARTAAAVKASAVLVPRIVSQVTARWRELLQARVELSGATWFTPQGRAFYEEVLQKCERCRGRVVRSSGDNGRSAVAQLAYRGDLFELIDELTTRVRAAGLPFSDLPEVDEARTLVRFR